MAEIISKYHSPEGMKVSTTETPYRPTTILDSSAFKPDEKNRLTIPFSSMVMVEVRGGTWRGSLEPAVGVYSTVETATEGRRQRITRVDYVIKKAGEEVSIKRQTSLVPSTRLELVQDCLRSRVSSFFNPEPYSFNGKVEIEEQDGARMPIFRYFKLHGMELMEHQLNNINPKDYGRYN